MPTNVFLMIFIILGPCHQVPNQRTKEIFWIKNQNGLSYKKNIGEKMKTAK